MFDLFSGLNILFLITVYTQCYFVLVSGAMVRQSYTSQSDRPDGSGTLPPPCIVIAILLTILPML